MASKIIYKESGLTNQPDAPTGYKFVGFNSGDFSEKSGSTVSVIGGESSSYKVFNCLLSQSGTNNPTIVVLENTLGVTVSAIRDAAGQYTLTTSVGTFLTIATTYLSTMNTNYTSLVSGRVDENPKAGANTVKVFTTSLSSPLVPIDNILSSTPFEIRHYE